ncbi:MAG: hypothetical protein IKE43_11645 [Coriobacteriales bacterium]|nr:hypothetical protein [Coriobacteriales bacterium]
MKSLININVEAASMMRLLSLPANFFRSCGAGEMSSRVITMAVSLIGTMVMSHH